MDDKELKELTILAETNKTKLSSKEISEIYDFLNLKTKKSKNSETLLISIPGRVEDIIEVFKN